MTTNKEIFASRFNRLDRYRARALQNYLEALVKECGSLCAVSETYYVDLSYLYKIRNGRRLTPSRDILKRLGLDPAIPRRTKEYT